MKRNELGTRLSCAQNEFIIQKKSPGRCFPDMSQTHRFPGGAVAQLQQRQNCLIYQYWGESHLQLQVEEQPCNVS